jgi:phosphatidylglycerol:prolipoprotein diacylglycerol transferase
MYPVLFEIGPLTIYTYGFFVFLGIICGYFFCLSQAKRYSLCGDKISDLIFWSIISGFVSARVLYIAINLSDFLEDPLSLIISGSGFVFYGGLLGGVLFAWWFIKRKKLPLCTTLDLISPSLSLGHSLGRVGCFFYGCCFGRPTDSFIGVVFPLDSFAGISGKSVIPTQIISSFFLLVIFVLLLIIRDRRTFKGEVFLSYIILYSIFRFVIEFYRADPRGFILFFSTSQWIALVLLVLGCIFWFKLKKTLRI